MLSDHASSAQSGVKFESWKEIAAYFNRGLRTVQRWERQERLPVHRHIHEKAGSIYGYKTELDAWLAIRRESPRKSQKHKKIVLAVLPFDDLRRTSGCPSIGDDLAEEIIIQIASLDRDGLAVVARSALNQYKNSRRGHDRVGSQLRIDCLLEGTIRREGKITCVTTQLISADGGTISWAKRFESTETKTQILQAQIAVLIARSVISKLSGKECHDSRAGLRLACA